MKTTSIISGKVSTRITVLLIFLVVFSSCELATLLSGPTASDEIIKQLELDATHSGNLLGFTVVEGKIKNGHYKTVSDVKLKASVYDNSSRLVEQEDFSLSVSITPDGEATFKEHLSTKWKQVSNVHVEIVSARD